MMNLGRQHQSLVLALAPDLLSSHPYLESLEPDVNDPACIFFVCLKIYLFVMMVTGEDEKCQFRTMLLKRC